MAHGSLITSFYYNQNTSFASKGGKSGSINQKHPHRDNGDSAY